MWENGYLYNTESCNPGTCCASMFIEVVFNVFNQVLELIAEKSCASFVKFILKYLIFLNCC